MLPRRTTEHDGKTWRCPCGSRHFAVKRTEHDEDSLPIRIRTCRNCGTAMATEERPISLSSFYTRATSHSRRNRQAARQRVMRCRKCGGAYGYGRYSAHVQTDTHLAVLRTAPTPHSRKIERMRRRREYWKKRGIDLDITTQVISQMAQDELRAREAEERVA